MSGTFTWPKEQINSWDEFIDSITRLSPGPARGEFAIDVVGQYYSRSIVGLHNLDECTFRGQSNCGWTLKPSLARIVAGATYDEARQVEAQALEKFKNQSANYSSPDKVHEYNDLTRIGWWQLMQHFRAPTRLLDWTASPYIAAYFAVVHNWDKDGIIWWFYRNSIMGLISNNAIFDDEGTVEDWVTARDYFPQSVNWTSKQTLVFQGIQKTRRLRGQYARFTIADDARADHAENIYLLVQNRTPTHYGTLVIPHRLKPEFLRRLREEKNVSASTIFGDLDGVGLSIEEFVRLRAHR